MAPTGIRLVAVGPGRVEVDVDCGTKRVVWPRHGTPCYTFHCPISFKITLGAGS